MSKFHIGRKIKEVLDQKPFTVVDFAKSINLTRNGAYKVFEKETIDTGQLQAISKVLEHDFFSYYHSAALQVKEHKEGYGYATKAELAEVFDCIKQLSKKIDELKDSMPKEKKDVKKNYKGKK